MVLLSAFLLGVVNGFRSLVVPAVVAWGASLGWLDLQGTRLSFMGSTTAVVIFSLLGIAELIADKLPRTPNRTSPAGLIARLGMGALGGACLAVAGGQVAYAGAILGSVGGLVGAFMGFQARTRTVKALQVPDFVIALLEDMITLAAAFFIVSRFH